MHIFKLVNLLEAPAFVEKMRKNGLEERLLTTKT